MPKFGTIPIVIFEKEDRVKHKKHRWQGTVVGKMFHYIDVRWDGWHYSSLEKEENLELIANGVKRS